MTIHNRYFVHGHMTRTNFIVVKILNYALTLEHLENVFYHQGLANYTRGSFKGINVYDRGSFYGNLREVAFDEQTHVGFLEGAFGKKTVKECAYYFPSKDAASFIALAVVLICPDLLKVPELALSNLGAAKFISSKDHLTYTGSILTVFTLAASFIVSCPRGNKYRPQLKLKPFPPLRFDAVGCIRSGEKIILQILADIRGKVYATFLTVAGPIYVKATKLAKAGEDRYLVTVPQGINGQRYVVFDGMQVQANR
ncbi:ferritin-like domain-containing protein [Bisporella sp. PMI_857]|nr:ferritin-like domain-containing protein [Bisporella sp. PMI_857]